MCEHDSAGDVGTDTVEVLVVDRRLAVFVEGWMVDCEGLGVELFGGGGVPGYTEAVGVEEPVSCLVGFFFEVGVAIG